MYLTVKDVMERYQVGRTTLYKWINQGMPSHKLGPKMTRFLAKETDAWVEANLIKEAK